MKDKKIPLVCVVGPTASGKTGLGVKLCKEFNGEVISADSMQIYRGMPIAAAVPDQNERQDVPHHLMEFLDISENFSVADYVNLAHKTINDIYKQNKLPVVVGGTGLYVNSLVDNIQFVDEPTDLELRKRLQIEQQELGEEVLLERLRGIDPDYAAKLHPNNRRRVVRALELFELTGKTMTKLEEESRSVPSPYKPCIIGLTYADREFLYERIRARVDIMLECGLLNEAKSTFEKNIGGAAQAIGHKELHRYLSGELSLDEAIELLKRETCHYAKRQLTWFKRDERVNWIECDKCEDILEEAKRIIKEAKTDGWL